MERRRLADGSEAGSKARAGVPTVAEGWRHADLDALEKSLGINKGMCADGAGSAPDDYHSFVSYRAFLAGADWARRQRAYHAAHEWVDFDETESAWVDWATDQQFVEDKLPRPEIEERVNEYFTEPPARQPQTFYHFHG